MNKQFVPYTLALKLKELGFDEECLGRWLVVTEWEKPTGEIKLQLNIKAEKWDKNQCSAPLWQQAFEWMREKHELVVDWNHSQYDNAGSYIGVSIKNIHLEETIVGVYKSYEEAQEECLTKLIEIVKNNAHI
jgi:hypothetical protein